MITIQSIVYKPKGAPIEPDRYTRIPIQGANLVAGFGIEGDRKGGNPKRNLNVMDDRTLVELRAEGYPTEPGTLGENLILAGVDLRTLPTGTHLRLGHDAVIKLISARVPCEQLTPIDDRMPENVTGRVGIMCRVVESGTIHVGDLVEILGVPESMD
ncbi:MAG: MOSC domain-containing protein [Aggregatilineales bacterium]